MHPETHLQLHDIRSAELRRRATDFRLAHPRTDTRAPHTDLRTRLGWTMVELGLRLLPERPCTPSGAPRTA
ncbi:hypothetical protein [Streptomyces brevispora]|uniref:Uncharacterized protein n=1 Tax=Streptomyces brevispora TaxID=887462 RepID=A0A561UVQ1_9ACTN|nr:hypothetical protein [Streptomyces brevispora]TWG03431.1 hypothetical protein FHX80_111857 [Streptomyces brevispora]WSC15533.1 hypothetical protein OIE64_23660 [Streptomyces brevispora]